MPAEPASPPARVALITGCGGGGGIGAATARALATTGVAVIVTDVSPSGASDPDNSASGRNGLAALADEIVAAGGQASWLLADVSAEEDVRKTVQYALDRHGRLDILVNNAGAAQGDDRGDIEDIPPSAWDRVMAINGRGVFLMCRASLAPMCRQGWGRIINISSAVAKIPMRNRAIYTASKAAAIGFTQALAMDVANAGITVNAICPGSIRTGRAINTTRRLGWSNVEEGLAVRAKGIPVGRHGEPEEIAAMIVFLASDAGAYVTGQAISVDGGGLPGGNG